MSGENEPIANERDIGDGWTLTYAEIVKNVVYFCLKSVYPGGVSSANSTLFSKALPFSVPYTQRCNALLHVGGHPVGKGYASFSTAGLYQGHEAYGANVQYDIWGIIRVNHVE